MIAHVWTYEVHPPQVEAFRRAYGPDGEWATFFRQSEGYLGTVLLEQCAEPARFMTIDYFADEMARSRLVEEHATDYAEIDRKWEEATIDEEFVGTFRVDEGAGNTLPITPG